MMSIASGVSPLMNDFFVCMPQVRHDFPAGNIIDAEEADSRAVKAPPHYRALSAASKRGRNNTLMSCLSAQWRGRSIRRLIAAK